MRVQNIKEKLNSYMTAGTIGVLGGYSLKYALPLSEYEKADVFNPQVVNGMKRAVSSAKKEEFDNIISWAKDGSENITDSVLKSFKDNEKNILDDKIDDIAKNLSSASEGTKQGVLKLIDLSFVRFYSNNETFNPF